MTSSGWGRPTGLARLDDEPGEQLRALLSHVVGFIPPGAVLALMVFALLIANVGLDEVFNPKLRES